MKNFRRKALPALTMLVIAILCLTGVTYAWFTQGSNVAVKNIDVKVTSSSGGMLVAKNQNDTYTNSYDAGLVGTNQVTLSPVSTAGERIHDKSGDTEIKGSDTLNFFSGEVDTATGNSLKSATAATSGYIQFEIWFESLDAADKNVYFDYSSVDELFILGTGVTDVPECAASLRIAFVYQGTKLNKSGSSAWVDWEDTKDVYHEFNDAAFVTGTVYYEDDYVLANTLGQYDSSKNYYTEASGVYSPVTTNVEGDFANYYVKSGHKTTSDSTKTAGKTYYTKEVVNEVDKPLHNSIVIVEPRHNDHDASGLGTAASSNAQSYYGLKHAFTVDTTTDGIANDLTVPSGKDDYDYILKNSLPILPGSAPTAGSEIANIYKEVTTYTVDQCRAGYSAADKQALFTLKQGYSHVTVYIWIEGQDIDCTNSIADLACSLNLKFTVA